jgi:hypothetical protein
MFQEKKAVSRLVYVALFLKAGLSLVGCAVSQPEKSYEALGQEHREPSAAIVGSVEGEPAPSAAADSLLGHALSSGDSGADIGSERVGSGRRRPSAKAAVKSRSTRPSASSRAARARSERRARRRERTKRVFAGAAVVALAAAASANAANNSGGTSGGSSSGGSSSGGGDAIYPSNDPNPTNDAFLPGGGSYSNGAEIY